MLLSHLQGILTYGRVPVRSGVVEAVNGNLKALLRRTRAPAFRRLNKRCAGGRRARSTCGCGAGRAPLNARPGRSIARQRHGTIGEERLRPLSDAERALTVRGTICICP
jgi:hypothetical protein